MVKALEKQHSSFFIFQRNHLAANVESMEHGMETVIYTNIYLVIITMHSIPYTTVIITSI